MLFETWWWIPVSLAWWVAQNAQHEGAHCVAYKYIGATITEFVVYPTDSLGDFSLKFWKGGHTWAHMRAWVPWRMTPQEKAITAIAPQATNTILLPILLMVMYLAPDLPLWATALLIGLYVNNFVDGAFNLGSFYKPQPERPSSDAWKFQDATQINKWACRAGTAVWHLGFGIPLVLG